MRSRRQRSREGAKLVALVTAACVALVVVSAGAGAADSPVHVQIGNLDLTLDGDFTPKTLFRSKLTPLIFHASGRIGTVDGTHPLPLTEFILESDRNSAVDVGGLPVCRPSQLQSQDSAHARSICRDAIIGTGTGKAEIAFPEQRPIPVTSPLTIFNGGMRSGVTLIYVHAYITVPTPAAIVVTVKTTRVHNGRYGLRSVASIPKIAGGSGSTTYFAFTFFRKGVISAKCPDRRLQALVTGAFGPATRASAAVVRSCRAKDP